MPKPWEIKETINKSLPWKRLYLDSSWYKREKRNSIKYFVIMLCNNKVPITFVVSDS